MVQALVTRRQTPGANDRIFRQSLCVRIVVSFGWDGLFYRAFSWGGRLSVMDHLADSRGATAPAFPSVVSPDLLTSLKDFGHLYYVKNHCYWVRRFFVESLVRELWKTLGVWNNDELLAWSRRIGSKITVVFCLCACSTNLQPCCSFLYPSYWLIILVPLCLVLPRIRPGFRQLHWQSSCSWPVRRSS